MLTIGYIYFHKLLAIWECEFMISSRSCIYMSACTCVCLLYPCIFSILKMKGNSLSRCLPKPHQNLFISLEFIMHPLSTSVLFLTCFCRLACDQNDLDSNEFAYANTSRSQSFQSVQLRVEGRTQNGTNNGTPFIPRVWLILEPILKINKFNVVI